MFEAQDDSPYRFVIRGVRSSDNGRTWATTRELVYRPRNPVVNRWAAGAPSIIRLPDKRLLVSFQSDEQVSYLQGDRRRDPAVQGYDYVRHSHFAYVTSSDNGRTWTRPQHLLGSPEQPACWNALYGLKNGTIWPCRTTKAGFGQTRGDHVPSRASALVLTGNRLATATTGRLPGPTTMPSTPCIATARVLAETAVTTTAAATGA